MNYRTKRQWLMFSAKVLLLPLIFWLLLMVFDLSALSPWLSGLSIDLEVALTIVGTFAVLYLLLADHRRQINTLLAQAFFGWQLPEHGVLTTGRIVSMVNVGLDSEFTRSWRIRRWILPSIWWAEVAFDAEADRDEGRQRTALVRVGAEAPGLAMLVGHEVELKYLPGHPTVIEAPGLRSELLLPTASRLSA